MSETRIIDLPEEILENIFLKIPYFWYDKMTDLTLVCKKFNDVISNSSRLMQPFHVFWRGNKLKDTEVLLNSRRKFRGISIRKVNNLNENDLLLQFINMHQSTITSVHLTKCTLNTSEFEFLMETVHENIDCISMCDVGFLMDNEPKTIEFPKMNWIELMYGQQDGYSAICNIFKGAKNVNHFSYEDDQVLNSDDGRKFSELIASLKGLKHLSVSEKLSRKLFVDDYFAEMAQFKLEHIQVWMNSSVPSEFPINTSHYRHLQNFISSQQNSLTSLNLSRCSISTEFIDFILGMKNLKKLFMFDCAFQVTSTLNIKNNTIKKFKLNMDSEYEAEGSDMETAICYILKNCINLQSLGFRSVILSFDISLNIINHAKNLRKLSLAACTIHPTVYPTITSIIFDSRTMDHDEIIKLIRLNRQLKNLKLPGIIQSHPKYSVAMNELNLEKIDFYNSYFSY